LNGAYLTLYYSHLERRPLANTLHATIDLDAAWARLSSLPLGRPPEPNPTVEDNTASTIPNRTEQDDDYIAIKRTTRFAGEVTTEEKRVHKHSAEARIYLQEQEAKRGPATEIDENAAPEVDNAQVILRRPLKRLSRFEPNPTGEVKALPPHLQLRWPRNKRLAALDGTTKAGIVKITARLPDATKLNTVDKSRHDWAGFVDKEGIAEELNEYGKSKASYLGRTEFLNRTENRREEERREAKQQAV
jgi:hypothetical protein